MNSGRARFSVLAVAVATLTMLVATMTPARAQTPAGAGTTASTQTLLGVHVGDILGLDLLTDQGSAVTKDALSALASISGIKLTLLGQETTLGGVTASLPNGQASQKESLALDNLPAPLNAILGGEGLLPLDVNALLGEALATAGGTASILNLNVLAGVLGIDSVTSKLTQSSAAEAAGVDRSLDVTAISLLNLGSLLDMLGIDLSLIGVAPLLNFLKGLGLPDLTSIAVQLDTAVLALDTALHQVTKTIGDLTQPVQDLLKSLFPNAGLDTVLQNLLGLVDTLITQVTNLLSGVINGLDNISLLDLSAIKLGATANAASTAEASSASADCSVGSVKVANLGLDLDPVLGLLGSVGKALTDLLGMLQLGIENLLNLSVCGTQILGTANTGVSHDVSTANGVVTAKSSASAISLSLNPGELSLPIVGRLCELLDTCPATDAAGASSLQSMGHRGVAQANPLDLLDVLTNGLSVNVGTVQAEATHVVNATAPAPGPAAPEEPVVPLPRTGGDNTMALLLAAAVIPLAILGLRIRRRLEQSKV